MLKPPQESARKANAPRRIPGRGAAAVSGRLATAARGRSFIGGHSGRLLFRGPVRKAPVARRPSASAQLAGCANPNSDRVTKRWPENNNAVTACVVVTALRSREAADPLAP